MLKTIFNHIDQDQNQKILLEQVKILYQILLPILIISLVVSSALVYGLWNVTSQTVLTVWMSLMLIVLILRAIYFFIYQRHSKPEKVQKDAMYYVIGNAAAGLVWGVGAVMLFPTQGLEYQLFILFVLVGMGAGSISTHTAYLPAFFAYFPTSMLPICIKLLLIGDPIHLSLGIMTVAYIIALTYLGTKINRTLKQSLKLRFENIDLVKQLREQKNEAEHANIAKSKFLAAASHDLRQPLYALTLFTSVLDESIKYPKVRRVVDQIKASVQSLQSLFNALLDISQLDAGVMKAEKFDFSLQPLFENLANDYDAQAKQKGLKIVWPNCSFTVNTDPMLFEQILRNYISNAIRYTDRGEVRISCVLDEESVIISVIDTGIGIPVKDQKVIFEEFHQLTNPERDRSKGLGLGLAIVQRTASLLEHSIDIVSKPGEGSTFSINLDKAIIDESTVVAISDVMNKINRDSIFMVVIDDEASVREGTQSLLQLWGCDVITAADKQGALTQIRQQNRSPDGIIADYRLRENHTGVEVIRAIHAEFSKDIPALIVTGDIAAEHLREVNSSGFQVLHKPVAPVKLRTFLRNVQLRK